MYDTVFAVKVTISKNSYLSQADIAFLTTKQTLFCQTVTLNFKKILKSIKSS